MRNFLRKKYELLKGERNGLYRIRALKDFGDVKKGDIGGYVNGYHNLSQEGNCWIYDNAKVLDEAIVCDNSKIHDNATILDNAKISDNVEIYNNVMVYDDAKILNGCKIHGNVKVYNNAVIYNNVRVYDNVEIFGKSIVGGNSEILKDVKISGNAKISGNVLINKGRIIGEITENYDKILFIQCENRVMTIYSKGNKTYCNVCGRTKMTLEDLKNKINFEEDYLRIMEVSRALLGLNNDNNSIS